MKDIQRTLYGIPLSEHAHRVELLLLALSYFHIEMPAGVRCSAEFL